MNVRPGDLGHWGAAGFIGFHVAQRLLEAGRRVVDPKRGVPQPSQ
jgi:nucleoside-diphosphate-sugar epimerase